MVQKQFLLAGVGVKEVEQVEEVKEVEEVEEVNVQDGRWLVQRWQRWERNGGVGSTVIVMIINMNIKPSSKPCLKRYT